MNELKNVVCMFISIKHARKRNRKVVLRVSNMVKIISAMYLDIFTYSSVIRNKSTTIYQTVSKILMKQNQQNLFRLKIGVDSLPYN